MKEYWKNPEAMEEKFAGEWCLTGDLGYADDEGYVYFQGRADDVIKTSGYRVGPAEVEASIMEVKGVASCAVIGVPDAQRGQAIKAFVKVMPSIDKSDRLITEIQAHVKKKLAAHEYPRAIEFIDEFPMTVTGKIRRRDLREQEIQKLSKSK
jgi:acetyl-CoA synthetase